MKRIVLILSVMMLAGCYETPEELTADFHGAGQIAFPRIIEIKSGIFNSNDIENAYVEFVVDVDSLGVIDSLVVYQTFYGVKTFVVGLGEFPSSIKITSAEAVELIPDLSIPDLQVGDEFVYEVMVVTESGEVVGSNEGVMIATVSCKSLIVPGMYKAITSGVSTDDLDNAVLNDFEAEIMVSATEVSGVFELSDYSGKITAAWYKEPYGALDEVPGYFKDVCNSLTYLNTSTEGGDPVAGTGSFDPKTNTITLTGKDTFFEDTWTMILTPKP